MRIIIDPRLKFNYASWYLLGIKKYKAKHGMAKSVEVSFDQKPFAAIPYANMRDYNSGFAMVVAEGGVERKVFICTEDVAMVFPDRYEWCDVYAMVNPTSEQVRDFPKLMPIGPEFGVALYSRAMTVFNGVKRYCQVRNYTQTPLKEFLRDYVYTFVRRRPLQDYEKRVKVRPNYVFHASTLWYNDFAGSETNMYRGEFLKACQKAGMEIGGGLFYLGESPAVLREMSDYSKYKDIYKDFIYDKRLSMDDYILKTKESVLVFNTPSVCGCHGWKLGEYLCMGKAIVSSPLSREMPGEGLIHGENVHFVASPGEIYDAVVKINSDAGYRRKLENGARAYYEKYLAPEVVVSRIIEKAVKG